jgi:hypothetical protein
VDISAVELGEVCGMPFVDIKFVVMQVLYEETTLTDYEVAGTEVCAACTCFSFNSDLKSSFITTDTMAP